MPNTRRSHTAPPGPICANSVAAIAEPNWTDAIAPTTSAPDGARVSSPGGGEIAAVFLAATRPMLTVPAIVIDGATLAPRTSLRSRGMVARRARAGGARAQRGRARGDRALLARGGALYGATTGVGALRDRMIGDADRERFQWNLLRSHAVSAGRPLAPSWSAPAWSCAPTSSAPAARGSSRRCSTG